MSTPKNFLVSLLAMSALVGIVPAVQPLAVQPQGSILCVIFRPFGIPCANN